MDDRQSRHVAPSARAVRDGDRGAIAVAAGALPFALMTVVGGHGIDASLSMSFAVLGVAAIACACVPAAAWRMSRAVWPMAAAFALAAFWPLLVREWRGAALLAPDMIGPSVLELCGFAAAAIIGITAGGSSRRFSIFTLVLVACGLAYTLAALGARWDPMADAIGASQRFQATLGNANAAACVFGMIALLALGLVCDSIGPTLASARTSALVAAGLGAVTLVLCLGAIGLTQSRFALTATIALGAWTVSSGRLGIGARIMVIAGLALLPLWLTAGNTLMRLDSTLQDLASRVSVYEHLIAVAMRAPLTGHGLAGFEALHGQTLSLEVAQISWNWRSAHNIVLHAWLEGGAPFVLALAALFAMLAAPVIAALRRTDDLRFRATLAAAVLPFAFSMFDIALNVTAIAIFFSLLLGSLWARARLAAGVGAPLRERGVHSRTARAVDAPIPARFGIDSGAIGR